MSEIRRIAEEVLKQYGWNTSKMAFFASFVGQHSIRKGTINAHEIQKLFKKHYEFASRNLYFLAQPELFTETRLPQEVKTRIQKLNLETAKEISRAKDVFMGLAEELVKKHHLEATQSLTAKEVLMPMTSDSAKSLAEMYMMADAYVHYGNFLYAKDTLDSKTRFQNASLARHIIQGMMLTVKNNFSTGIRFTGVRLNLKDETDD